jgi:hypothetical protein
MFSIDTGDTGGSKGPWLSWTSNGSAEKGFAPRSWVLREKDEASGQTILAVIPAFVNGCVMDLDTLKLGWEKDGAKGQAPERRWNPSVSQSTPRPDESKKASGAYAWSRALSVRCAIGGGKAATWEQGSFGAYDAFTALSKQIMAQWASHSQNGTLLPLVKQVGVEKRQLPSGTANIPTLTIDRWVPRPACLCADAPVISAEPEEYTPAKAAPPPAAPAPAAPADAEF